MCRHVGVDTPSPNAKRVQPATLGATTPPPKKARIDEVKKVDEVKNVDEGDDHGEDGDEVDGSLAYPCHHPEHLTREGRMVGYARLPRTITKMRETAMKKKASMTPN